MAPRRVKIASWEFTVCTIWSRPTASELSEGFRSVAVPCGPVKPTPSPSNATMRRAAGAVPTVVYSTAAAPSGTPVGVDTTGALTWTCRSTGAAASGAAALNTSAATARVTERRVEDVMVGQRYARGAASDSAAG